MKRYTCTGSVDEGDLLQAAYFAMLEAVRQFDEARGSFSTLYIYRLRIAYAKALGLYRRHVEEINCLDAPLEDNKDTCMRDLIEDENAVDPQEHALLADTSDVLREALQQLPPKALTVILDRYFHGLTQRQCAKKLGITPQRIHSIELDALRRLRHNAPLRSAYYGMQEEY